MPKKSDVDIDILTDLIEESNVEKITSTHAKKPVWEKIARSVIPNFYFPILKNVLLTMQ